MASSIGELHYFRNGFEIILLFAFIEYDLLLFFTIKSMAKLPILSRKGEFLQNPSLLFKEK